MKAWLLNGYDGVKSMEFREDVEVPEPGDGEVLLRLSFAALNPADRYLADKQYPARPSFPHILGRDGLGIVEKTGPGVKRFRVGDKVAILRGEVGVTRRGTFAEFAAVQENLLIPVPKGWSDEETAGAPLAFLTAWQALTQWDFTAPGTILITGATGGVGVASVLLGKALGHRVIGMSRSAEKGAELIKLGADLILNPADEEVPQKVKEFTGREGVQIAVDNIGGAFFSQILATLGHRGSVSCVGRLAGPVPEFNTASLFFKRLRIGGVAVGTYTSAEAQENWTRVVAHLDRTGRKPVVDHVYPFAELKEAFARLGEGPLGKVLVRCG